MNQQGALCEYLSWLHHQCLHFQDYMGHSFPVVWGHVTCHVCIGHLPAWCWKWLWWGRTPLVDVRVTRAVRDTLWLDGACFEVGHILSLRCFLARAEKKRDYSWPHETTEQKFLMTHFHRRPLCGPHVSPATYPVPIDLRLSFLISRALLFTYFLPSSPRN